MRKVREAKTKLDTALSEKGPKDLGFGDEVSRRSQLRLLNRDGSFNVHRQGYSFFRSRSLYHGLLNTRWHLFLFSWFSLF